METAVVDANVWYFVQKKDIEAIPSPLFQLRRLPAEFQVNPEIPDISNRDQVCHITVGKDEIEH